AYRPSRRISRKVHAMNRPEFEFIEWMRRRIADSPTVTLGIGDDAAVLGPRSSPLLLTTDMLVEGVHFDFAVSTAFDVGRKAMNVNLSDVAAMAGRPLAALVAVALPSAAPARLAEELFDGVQSAAARFDVPIVGGDTNRSTAGLVVAVTILGEAVGPPILRSGAKPDDVLMVTGPLGYSLDGKHLSFTPRVHEALELAAFSGDGLHALMDLSDGLGGDLFHLLDESGCGAVLDADRIPIRTSTDPAMAADGRPPLDHALDDGEDFELLAAVAPETANALLARQPLQRYGVRLTAIGRFTAERTAYIVGREVPAGRATLQRRGYVHRW
ncbi:MAG: thiamine-phosphate kinase, partial [Planctomycetia bacterium]